MDRQSKSKEITLNQAKKIVQNVIKTPIVPFLWGPPGVGKSSLVREICKEQELELIDLRLSLLNPVDLRGLPVVDKESRSANWFSPSFLPKFDTKTKGILFLDEINLAPLSVQAAAYQLILDKKVGEYRFPTNWRIIAAGNRETDKANVFKISAPLANRFVHLTVGADFQTWKDWAKEKVKPEIIEYLIMRPSLLLQMPSDSQKAFPSPRTWEFTSQLLDAFEYEDGSSVNEELAQLICGAIGESVGKEFINFLEEYSLKEISKQVDVFIVSGKLELPKKMSVRYALITAIYDAYKAKKIDDEKYKVFTKQLTPEERETIKEFEKENTEEVQAKYQQPTKKLVASLTRNYFPGDGVLYLSNTALIPNKGKLELSDGKKLDIIEYDGRNSLNVTISFSTSNAPWPSGTLVHLV